MTFFYSPFDRIPNPISIYDCGTTEMTNEFDVKITFYDKFCNLFRRTTLLSTMMLWFNHWFLIFAQLKCAFKYVYLHFFTTIWHYSSGFGNCFEFFSSKCDFVSCKYVIFAVNYVFSQKLCFSSESACFALI